MPKYSYPLLKYEFPDGSSEPFATHAYLPLKISNPDTGKNLKIAGVVDTGADACLFPAHIAEITGHNLKGDGVKSTITMGIEQNEVPVYKHTFLIELLSPPDYQKVIWSSGEILIDCTEANPPVLLGTTDFLRHFKVSIDYPKEQLTAEW